MLPILYQNHELILYSYPLMMGIGWGVAYQVFFSLSPVEQAHIKAQILFWGMFLSSWVGAKILFLITQPQHMNIISEVSFWTGGGFVFYGGFIGAALFCFIYNKAIVALTMPQIWPIFPALVFGHGLGRVGCFLAGCCFGKETDLWWGVFLHGSMRHPTQLIEAAGLILMGFYFLKSKKEKWILIARYFYFYGALRLLVESLRGDSIRGNWGLFTPSQWISIILIIVGTYLTLKPKKSMA
jgi:phosphatidylglycerol:prolipoprotein diacylglycerol transferase